MQTIVTRLLQRWRASRSASSHSHPEAGDTLIEILIALVIIGIAGVALLTTFETSINASAEYKTLSTFDTVMRSAIEEATANFQQTYATNGTWCSVTTPVALAAPAPYTAEILSVQYWSSTTSSFSSTCTNGAEALVQVQVSYSSTTQTLSAVVMDPTAQSTSCATTPTKLVFLQEPTSTPAATSFYTAPAVAVENASGAIACGDWSSLTLSVGSGPGTMTGCNNAEFGGVVTFSGCTITTAGTYTLTVSATGLSPMTSTSFSITAGSPTQLAFVQQPSATVQGTAISPAVTVQVEDTFGNAVQDSGVVVTLTPSSNSISSGASATTDATGLATFSSIVMNTPSTYTLTATASGLTPAASSSFSVSGVATKLAFSVAPSNTTAGSVMSPSVQVQVETATGASANISGALITLTPSSGSIAAGATATTNATGLATFSGLVMDTAGSYTLTASTTGLSPASSGSFNITAGSASKLVFVAQPTNTAAGSTMSPAVTVQVEDAYSNAVSGVVSITLAPSMNSIASGATANTNAAGLATFSSIKMNSVASGYTLTASSGALTPGTSGSFNITAGSPSQWAFVAEPSNTTAGSTMSTVTVQAEDAYGNNVADSGVLVTLSPSSSSITSGATATTNAAGLATFSSIKMNVAASGYTLTASGSTLSAATSTTFNIAAASASTWVFISQPSNTTSGVAMSPAVTVQAEDTYGNNAADSGVLVTLTPSSNSIASGGTATTNASGLATFSSIKMNTVANGYTLTASGGGLSTATSGSFNITGVASKLAFIAQPRNTQAGSTMSPSVTVQIEDASGNAVAQSGTLITLTPSSNSITSGATATTNAAGLATFSGITMTAAGSGYTLSATGPGLTAATSSTFNITAATASQLVWVVQPSNVTHGVSMSPAVTVQIEDGYGNPVSTSGVTITLTPSRGSISSGATATTNASGLATFAAIKFSARVFGNPAPTLTASGGGLTSAASNSFTVS